MMGIVLTRTGKTIRWNSISIKSWAVFPMLDKSSALWALSWNKMYEQHKLLKVPLVCCPIPSSGVNYPFDHGAPWTPWIIHALINWGMLSNVFSFGFLVGVLKWWRKCSTGQKHFFCCLFVALHHRPYHGNLLLVCPSFTRHIFHRTETNMAELSIKLILLLSEGRLHVVKYRLDVLGCFFFFFTTRRL